MPEAEREDLYPMKRVPTEALKESLADALLKLLADRPIDQIRISEIADAANVSRITYYRNFNSKEDVLYFKCMRMAERWYAGLTPEQISSPARFAEAFYEQTYARRDILMTLYRAKLHHILLASIYRVMQLHHKAYRDDDEAYASAFFAYGMFGILSEWIKGGCRKTPRQLAALTMRNVQIKDA